ncbi:hypothetical protein B0H14DRAFT_3505100 [Mycena olivaceomarginata]|nr:hypothetical protein B0H14DRAFT_3505100 [Mycena olivaceomarginata]
MDDAKVSLRRASLRRQREMTKLIGNATAGVSFGLVPKEHWFQPEWIDEDKARAGRNTAALFASKKQLHFFEDVGYQHQPFQHCLQDAGQ